MRSLKGLMERSLCYFYSINGIADFCVDTNLKSLRWSKIWPLYRRAHNLIVIILTVRFVNNFWNARAAEIEQSLMLTINFLVYFTLVYLSVLSCMDCAYRKQNRVFKIKEKLLDLERLSEENEYAMPKDKQDFLFGLRVFLVTLLILRLIIHVTLNVLRSRMGFNYSCNCFLPEGMIFAMNALAFNIMAGICQCWWRTLSGLEKLLLDKDYIAEAEKLRQIRKLQATFQCLIDLTAEVTCTFKYVFLCYLARNLWSGIVVGYLIVRMCLGQGSKDNEFMHILLAFVTCIQPLMYSLLMNCIFHTTDTLLESVRDALRQSHVNEARVERTMEWFAVQLARQHTFIKVYGTFRINRSLAFRSCAVILIHVLYMVQADYTAMFK